MDIARETMAYTRNNILIQVAQAMFTVDDLWTMDVVYADYTFIDNSPSVVINYVTGVRLADVMDAAGLELNSSTFCQVGFSSKGKKGHHELLTVSCSINHISIERSVYRISTL